MPADHPVVSLEDALFSSITGRTPRSVRAGSVGDQLNLLAGLLGNSLRAVARELGEPKTSVTAWANGTRRPSKKALQRLAGKLTPTIRRHLLSPGEEQRLRGRQIQVTGTDRYDDRYRKITPKGDTAGAVVDAFLRGGDTREAFCDAIVDPANFYPGYFRSDDPGFGIDIEKVDWL